MFDIIFHPKYAWVLSKMKMKMDSFRYSRHNSCSMMYPNVLGGLNYADESFATSHEQDPYSQFQILTERLLSTRTFIHDIGKYLMKMFFNSSEKQKPNPGRRKARSFTTKPFINLHSSTFSSVLQLILSFLSIYALLL